VRLAGATLLALAALAAPASADTVAHRTPAVGPAFAGDRVAWGEETKAGGLRILAGSPAARPRVLGRVKAPTARKTDRSFFHTPWAFSASPTRLAAIVLTNTITSEGSDFVGTSSVPAAIGGPLSEPPRLLAGSSPPRAAKGCRGAYRSPQSVAVDGSRIALLSRVGTCGTPGSRTEIAILEGSGQRAITVDAGGPVVKFRFAGPYVAWDDEAEGHTLVVHDYERGVEIARESRFAIDDFDLAADGTVALTYADGPRDRRVAVLSPGRPGLRVLDRDVASRGVALAGGRVLYERLGRRDFHSRLMLRRVDGGAARRLARFTPTRRRVGDLDLSRGRAAWAAQRTRRGYDGAPRGPARIVARRL